MFDSTHWALPPPAQIPSHHLRHMLSRRAFIGSMAGAAGAAVGAGLFATSVLAKSSNAAPKPTTNKLTPNRVPFSLAFFGPGQIGVADVWAWELRPTRMDRPRRRCSIPTRAS